MSPQAVTQRLIRLSQLRRLVISLEKAGEKAGFVKHKIGI